MVEGLPGSDRLTDNQIFIANRLIHAPNHVVTYYDLHKNMAISGTTIYKDELLGGLDDFFERYNQILERHNWNRISLGIGLIPAFEDLPTGREELNKRLRLQLGSEILEDIEHNVLPAPNWKLIDNVYLAIPEIHIGKFPPIYAVLIRREKSRERKPNKIIFVDSKEQLAVLHASIESGGYLDENVYQLFTGETKVPNLRMMVNRVNDHFLEFLNDFIQVLPDRGYAINGEYKHKVDHIHNWIMSTLGKNAEEIEAQLEILESQGLNYHSIQFSNAPFSVKLVKTEALFTSINPEVFPWDPYKHYQYLMILADSNGCLGIELTSEENAILETFFQSGSTLTVPYDAVETRFSSQDSVRKGFQRLSDKIQKRGYTVSIPGKATTQELTFPLIFIPSK